MAAVCRLRCGRDGGGSRGGVAAMAAAARAQGGDGGGGRGPWVVGGCRRWRPGPGLLVARSRRLGSKGQPWFGGQRQCDVRVVATPQRHHQLKCWRPRALGLLRLHGEAGGLVCATCFVHHTRHARFGDATPRGHLPSRLGFPASGQAGCARGPASHPGHCAAPQRWLPLQTCVSAQAPEGGGLPSAAVGEGRRVTLPPGRSCAAPKLMRGPHPGGARCGGAAAGARRRRGRHCRCSWQGGPQRRGAAQPPLARLAATPSPVAAAVPLQSWAGTQGRRGLSLRLAAPPPRCRSAPSEAGGQGRDGGLVPAAPAAVQPPGPLRFCGPVAGRGSWGPRGRER